MSEDGGIENPPPAEGGGIMKPKPQISPGKGKPPRAIWEEPPEYQSIIEDLERKPPTPGPQEDTNKV